MAVFLERFVLPVLASLAVTVIVGNAFKVRIGWRVVLFAVVMVLAGFVSYKITAKSSSSTIPVATFNGKAETHGSNSPNVINNNGTINIGAPPAKDDKQ